ncbi:MAG: Ig-like domain-containing protein [bacterium]
MSYSMLFIKKRQKILYILGTISALSLLMGSLLFFKQISRKNGWQQTAGIDRLYVVNRSPHGFEVVWSTKNTVKTDQWVEVGSQKGMYPIMGKLDHIGEVYHANVTGLKADTTYYFRVRVGTSTYILPSLVSETIHTPKEMKENPISPAYGKVVLPSTRPYANGLLIYEIDGYYPLAVFTKETGEWLLPLTGLIEKKSNTITFVTNSLPVSIKLFSYPEAAIQTYVGQTRPLKQAIIAGISLRLAQSTQGKDEAVLGVSSQTIPPQTKTMSSIIYPKENALIPGTAPLIRGTGSAGKSVTVLIQAPTKQYSYRTKADEKGNWLVQYPLALEPGKYTIIATIENSSGLPTVLRRIFSIIKSGEQVLGAASGSSTLTPTVLPTSASAPTQEPTNTQIPTILPTTFVPTTTPPVTGGGMSGFLFGALFCIVIGTGLVLAF